MNLRTVFLYCFATACLPALGWSAWIAARAQSEWVSAAAAVRAAEAMGDALHLVEALSIERGALQERALSDGPGVEDLAEIAARNDALLERTQHSMLSAGLPDEAVTQAREILIAARTRVAEAIVHPLAERDPQLVPAIMAQLYERLGAVEGAMALAEREVARADASVGALVAVGSLTVEMRDAAGRRSSHLSGWMGGRDMAPRQIDEAMYLTGQIQHAWDRLQRQVLMVGEPPRLAAAIAATHDGFFRNAEPRYRAYLATARAGDERPMRLTEWRRWTIQALRGTLIARDAAITEAVEHGRALAFAAQGRLVIAGAAMLGMFVLAGGALLVLLRRLVLPVQRLTAVVTRLANGDNATEIPERRRPDEIGAMAAAIEVFRQNAVDLRQTNLRFDAALSNMSHGIAMYDADERLVVANPRLCEISGVPPGSLRIGMTYREVLAVVASAGHFQGRPLDEVYAERNRFRAMEDANLAFEDVRGDRQVAVSLRPLSDGGCLFTLEDITERARNEARIAHMAHHDALTGMANRVLFRKRLDEAVLRARRGEHFSLLCLDLDRFKVVNDTLGHPAGDALLEAVAKRLRAELRETETVARLGGDEFAILQVTNDRSQQATALAQRLIAAIGAPYLIDGHPIEVGVSIGIAVSHGNDESADTLLKNADLALYRAKSDGRGTWRFFEPEMDAHMQFRRLLEIDLRQALAADAFDVHYQPVVNVRTGRVTAFEALLRWHHPERGLVAPAEFIPLAEDIGLIASISEWVLRRVCAAAVGWPPDIKVAVNLSAVQVRAGRRLTEMVTAVLQEMGLPAGRLEFEITETAMLQETEETLATLHELKALGIAIALDDFGTGYSSLSYLRRFPFDRVKIDRSFIAELGRTENDCSVIVRAVLGLCAGLGIVVTAEGVETEEQLAWLLAKGPVEVQGHLISHAVQAEAVPAVIETQLRSKWMLWS